MKTWQKVAVSLFILLLLTLQIIVIVGPFDDWPFASNSMFGFYRTPGDPVYDLVILVDDGKGTSRALDPNKDLGESSYDTFRRLFFGKWYGSTNPSYPQGKFPDDTRVAFTIRMTDFCQRVVSVMQSRGEAPISLRLAIHRMQREGDSWVTQDQAFIGTYQVSDGHFVLDSIR